MRTRHRGAAVVAAVGLLALVLAGCGAGRDASTSQDRPSVPGVNVNAEDSSVQVRNAAVAFSPRGYGTGGTAPVQLWLINNTSGPVSLVEVTSGDASAVTFEQLELPADSVVSTTLEATGLTRRFDFRGSLPLTLVFDNGAEVSMSVPMAPPMDDELPREPMTFDDDDH